MTVVASLISDIASLWILVSACVVLVVAVMFRKPIAQRIGLGGVKLQHRDTSVELERANEASLERASSAGTAADRPPEEPMLVPQEELGDDEGEASQKEVEESPDLDWIDVMRSLEEGERDEAQRMYEELRAKESSDEAKLRADVIYAFSRYRWGHDAEGLRDLEKFEANDAIGGVASLWKGTAYLEDGYPDKALDAYDAAAASAKDRSDRALAVVGAARSLKALDRPEEAVKRLTEALGAATTTSQKRQYFEALAEVYRKSGDWFRRALALEKCVELTPGNASLRFNAGYAYAEAGREDIALVHYIAAIEIDPSMRAALNNLGVTYLALEMPGTAMQHYKASSEQGETLAMANLAIKYINAGFFDEAREVLKKAFALPDPHRNVGTYLATLDEKVEAESDRRVKVTEEATRKEIVLLGMSDALFVDAPTPDVSGGWQFENGVKVEITQSGTSFTAQLQGQNISHQYAGTFTNRAIEGRYQHSETTFGTPAQTVLADKGSIYGWATDKKIELIVDENGKEYRETLSRRPDTGEVSTP